MPIYEYRCSSCGFQKDHLQKMSDAPLTTCPSCQAEAYTKQLSAAGFQLKGTGWYETDFKGGGSSNGTTAASTAETASSSASACAGGGCACH